MCKEHVSNSADYTYPAPDLPLIGPVHPEFGTGERVLVVDGVFKVSFCS